MLCEHLTPRKVELFEHIAGLRTRHIAVVMENIYQAQNSSAILRSAESFGIQDLHTIENEHGFQNHRRIDKGAQDWPSLHRYNAPPQNHPRAMCAQAAPGGGPWMGGGSSREGAWQGGPAASSAQRSAARQPTGWTPWAHRQISCHRSLWPTA